MSIMTHSTLLSSSNSKQTLGRIFIEKQKYISEWKVTDQRQNVIDIGDLQNAVDDEFISIIN